MEFYGMRSIFEGSYTAKLYMRPGSETSVSRRLFRNFESCIQWAVYRVLEISKGHPEDFFCFVVEHEEQKGDLVEERQKGYRSWDWLVRDVWKTLSDVPMDPETENIEDDWFIYPAGTNRETIWHWFDEQYHDGVAALMYA